ncbi:MAG: hypothetical protein LBD92_07325 [Oscillospiraceae bacterium]|jgi:hypothetical protein|nr:hypothetical protein [Oscillospiraceae bacterium]
MVDLNTIKKLALDLTNGSLPDKYDAKNASDVLRKSLIELNGGSSRIDLKAMRRNKNEYFELLEVIIPRIIQEGLRDDEFYNTLVEEHNLNLGDSNVFVADDNTQFIVSEIADGIARPRRQRIGQKTEVAIPTTWHAVSIYEEWSRFVSGRIDWNDIMDKVPAAFKAKFYEDVYAIFSGLATDTVYGANYVASGTYSEDTLLNIVDHVEAAMGVKAAIYGTRAALRRCMVSDAAVMSDEARTSYFDGGYYGKLAGVPLIVVRNVHKAGTDDFIFSDKELYIFGSGDKPIKYVREGEPWVTDTQEGKADKTIEYTYQEKYGVGLVANGRIGKYTMS